MPTRSDLDAWPGAQQWVPEHAGVRELREAVQACRGCDLWQDTTQAVAGAGPDDAALVLVGEQPGDREDREGEPFVGPAGRLLDRALTEAGIDPHAAFRTNAVKHFRHVDRGHKRIHRTPTRWHVAQCQPWLLAELDAVRPSTVVLLGATAAKAVLGPSFSVERSRGVPLDWPEAGWGAAPRLAVATVHPASVLRSRTRRAAYEALVADLRVVADSVAS